MRHDPYLSAMHTKGHVDPHLDDHINAHQTFFQGVDSRELDDSFTGGGHPNVELHPEEEEPIVYPFEGGISTFEPRPAA